MTPGQPADESEDLDLIPLTELHLRPPASALPIPLLNPPALPLAQLDPETFERLIAELVSRQPNLGVQFYGRRGQKQYGLDIVELELSHTRSLYQVKRYQTLMPSEFRAIVKEYAGEPRGS